MNTDISLSYKDSLLELSNTLSDCQKSSVREGVIAKCNLDSLLSALYVRICTIGRSIYYYSPKSIDSSSHWDYASIGSIVRNLIDALNSFIYLAEEDLSDSESECRLLIYELQDTKTRRKIFEFRNNLKEATDAAKREEEVKKDLEVNSFFKNLTEKRQKHFLKGIDPCLIDKEEIIRINGGDTKQFLGLYKFLSANAHSYPMGFYKMNEKGSGRGIHCTIEEEYTEMMLQLTTAQLQTAKEVYERIKAKDIA